MTITTLAASAPNTNDTDLAVLSVSRLLARLEHNLLSPGVDLAGLRKSEYQRMRVGAVCFLLSSLLPGFHVSVGEVLGYGSRYIAYHIQEMKSSCLRSEHYSKRN